MWPRRSWRSCSGRLSGLGRALCLAGSGECGQRPDAGEGFDERVGPGVGAGQAQPELAGVAHDPGGDVEERQSQAFAPAAAELAGQGELRGSSGRRCGPGRQACHHSQFPKKFCTGAWISPKSSLSWRMVSSGIPPRRR